MRYNSFSERLMSTDSNKNIIVKVPLPNSIGVLEGGWISVAGGAGFGVASGEAPEVEVRNTCSVKFAASLSISSSSFSEELLKKTCRLHCVLWITLLGILVGWLHQELCRFGGRL